ncbi:MAG: prenyltransferase/squalene oxidase repeat-containing protein, partial [Planctomycetota bacterium]
MALDKLYPNPTIATGASACPGGQGGSRGRSSGNNILCLQRVGSRGSVFSDFSRRLSGMMDNLGGRSPGRAALAVLTGLMLLALVSGEAVARQRGPRAPEAGYVDTSDAAVEKAIDKGAEFLWKLQQPDGSWRGWKLGAVEDPYKENYMDGPTALVAYALMESGVRPFDKKMTKALAWLENVNAKNPKT